MKLCAQAPAGGAHEVALDCGLVAGHAYAVSSIRSLSLDNKKSTSMFELFAGHERLRMIRLQNPWGEREWNGAWSDCSPEWQQVSEAQKKRLGIVCEEDGEFW